MIKIVIYKNDKNVICGFKAKNHGDPIVCSAVSILTTNTVNSIETFTDEHLVCEFEEKGGYLYFELPQIKQGKHNSAVNLLMKAMLLGLKSIENEYRKHIRISYKEV